MALFFGTVFVVMGVARKNFGLTKVSEVLNFEKYVSDKTAGVKIM